MARRGYPVGTSVRRYKGVGVRRPALVASFSAALVLMLTACASVAASATTSSSTTHAPTTSSSSSASSSTSTSTSAKPNKTATENLLTYHYQNARQGVDSLDPSFRHLTRAWTTSGSKIAGDIYAEPLVEGKTVFVVTEADDVYALSANTGAVEWRVNVGNPAQSSSVQAAPGLGGCGDIYPIGITGTPVVDPSSGVLYLAAEVQKTGATWTGVEHVMVAIRLNDHKILWSREIDPAHAGNGNGGTYIIAAEQQRSALSLDRGRVYAEFGGLSGDCSAYHGYVVSLPESGKPPLGVYQTPSPREDAIWATSGAAVNESGDLYVATGNGSDSDKTFKMDNAVIELSPSLKVISDYAPLDWAVMNDQDLDLGSGGPTLLPGESLLFEAGKASYPSGDGGSLESLGYLLNPKSLGGVGHPLFRGQVCPNAGYVFGANAVAVVKVKGVSTTVIFVPCPSGTVALAVKKGAHPSFTRIWEAPAGNPNGPPILAGGLIWAISTGSDGGGGGNDLYGMDPSTGKVLVTESLAQVDHFVTPAAGDGEIFVGTTDGVEAFRP